MEGRQRVLNTNHLSSSVVTHSLFFMLLFCQHWFFVQIFHGIDLWIIGKDLKFPDTTTLEYIHIMYETWMVFKYSTATGLIAKKVGSEELTTENSFWMDMHSWKVSRLLMWIVFPSVFNDHLFVPVPLFLSWTWLVEWISDKNVTVLFPQTQSSNLCANLFWMGNNNFMCFSRNKGTKEGRERENERWN